MAHEVPRLVLQALLTAYAPLKDAVSFMKGKAKYVRNLEDNLTKITADLATFYSRKEQIDRLLGTTVSKEKSDEYDILIKQIEVFQKRYDEFVTKYQGLCQKLPSFQTDDVSSATDVIAAVQERKPTVLTCKFFKLAKLSRKINKLLDDISRVIDKMKQENVLRDKKIEPVEFKCDDVDLPSSPEYVNKILGYLSEDSNRSVGILGPIGVGKTTILKNLNNQLKNSSMTMKIKFDVVIWIDFHKQQDVKDETTEMIQDVIMGRLKLEREKASSIEQNAEIISRFLWDKRYILLIDQVSSTINLDEVGIHKDHKFGKVVAASSSKRVIMPMIDQEVEIQPLPMKDALDLFQRVCGTIYDPRIKLIAESIVRSCGGLPLVIKLVANHLIGQRDEEVWSDVKRHLQSESKAKLQKLDGVGHAYKLAYDKLENSHKKCLLFVTLFPSDHKICKDYLVECWNAESFLELDVPQLRSARERGATTLRELTDQYLLENHSHKHVKMPEYFRKVAAQQEYPGENDGPSYMQQQIQPLTEETWRRTRRISLIRCKSKLPKIPSCDNISALLMQHNRGLVSLGDTFFQNMQKLLILDLHRTMIELLPNSISSLVSLRCLYLNECSQLAELPPRVKMLEKLELLDIRGTAIHSLPVEMGEMLQLRCLRISFGQTGCNRNRTCKEVEMTIPLNMISRLQHLEELTIEAGCCSQGWNDFADQFVIELACLEKLSTLNFHFPKVASLKKFVDESRSLQNLDTHWSTNTLRSFDISIGCCEMQQLPYGPKISRISQERRLRFSTNEDISSVREVLRQASLFELVSHCDVRSLSDFGLKNAGTLQACVVERCTNMTSFVDGPWINDVQSDITDETSCAVLQCLEKLDLFDLQSLQSIWRGPIFSGSLANLKHLTVFCCPKLTTILNRELANALSSLEFMKVEDCLKVVEIVNEEMPEDHNVLKDVGLINMLNKVMTVELVNLPALQSICKTTSINWKSLMRIVVISCNSLRDIHLSLRNAEKLETVECENRWWTALQLPEKQKQHFFPRCEFIAMEQKLAIGACHEGGLLGNGRSANAMASNVNVSNKCNGKVVHRNGNNMNSANPEDMPESSQRVHCVTHQSKSTNPTNKAALSLPMERSSNIGFSISSH